MVRRKYPYRDVQYCITVPYRFESCPDYKKVKPGEVVKVGLKQNYT